MCLADTNNIFFFDFTDRDSKSRSPALEERTITIFLRCGSVYPITTISRPWGEDDYHIPPMWFCLHYHHDLPPLWRGRLPLHHRCGSVYTITTISRPCGEDDYHYTTDVVLFTLSADWLLIDIVLYLIFIYAKIINIIVSFLKVLTKYFS